MIKPKEIEVLTQDGEKKTFIIHRFDCLSGREIATQYITANIPKVGSYAVSQELMLKLMAFVAVPMDNGTNLFLTTKALVTNHIPDWECGMRIEKEMMEYNCSFFSQGKISGFLQGLIETFQASISKTSMDLSAQLSQAAKQRSTN